METTLKQTASTFVYQLQQDATVQRYQNVRREFDQDQELHALRSDYARLAQELQSKQFDGTLTQADITRLRSLQQRINTHQTTARLIEAQNDLVEVLGNCNQEISSILGLDYSATAAPAAAC